MRNEYPSPRDQNGVVRIWAGRGTPAGVARYCEEHFPQHVLPQLRGLDGFVGARLLVRPLGDGSEEIVVATTWTSLDAVKAFAGEELERAVVEPAVEELLEHFDDNVTHFTIAADFA